MKDWVFLRAKIINDHTGQGSFISTAGAVLTTTTFPCCGAISCPDASNPDPSSPNSSRQTNIE